MGKSNSGRPLTLFPFPSLGHVPLGFQMNKYRSVLDTNLSGAHSPPSPDFARAEHLHVQVVVKLIIYVKLAEPQQCLQLNLPGSLEEMEYRKETEGKKPFFPRQYMVWTPLIVHTSAAFEEGTCLLKKKKKTILNCCLRMILKLGIDLILLPVGFNILFSRRKAF